MKRKTEGARHRPEEFDPYRLTLEERATAYENGARFLAKAREILAREAEAAREAPTFLGEGI